MIWISARRGSSRNTDSYRKRPNEQKMSKGCFMEIGKPEKN